MNPEFQTLPSMGRDGGASSTEAAPTESDSLRAELADQKDVNLRLAADFENYRRRIRQEGEARAFAQKESFIQELLPAIDNLERALAFGASTNSRQFHQGVGMTLQQLLLLLQQHGIETEESVGQPFDPRRHEAVSQRRDPAHAEHTILEVFQRGFRRGEKVFRPAKVMVNDWTHSNSK